MHSQSYSFSSNHVWMWELDYKESWVPKIWCFVTVVSEKTLQSSLDCKKIQTVHPKRDESWVFIGRTDVEAKTPILWPPDAKNWLVGCWGRLKAVGEADDRGWDGWMATLTQWTWVSVSSRSWWWTGKPGVLQPMGSQRVRHDWTDQFKRKGKLSVFVMHVEWSDLVDFVCCVRAHPSEALALWCGSW